MKTMKLKSNFLFWVMLTTCIAILYDSQSFVCAQHDMPAHDKSNVKVKKTPSQYVHDSKKNYFELDEIVVITKKVEDYIKNHPQNVISIDSNAIREQNFLNPAEALNSMPGVDVHQKSSGSGSRISIRGSGGSGSVLVLVDGRPVNAGQYGGVDLETIPIDIIQKITVFKPPVPVWLGPGSTAGAIVINTKDSNAHSSKTKIAKNNKGRLKTGFGSFEARNASCSYSIPHKKGRTMLSAGGAHKGGKRINSDRDNLFLSLNWDMKQITHTHYKLGGRFYHAEHGCPGPLYNLTPDSRQKYDKGSIDFSLNALTGKIGNFSLKTYTSFKDLEDLSQDGGKSFLEIYKVGAIVEQTWSENFGIWAFRLGGKVEQDSVDHTSTGNIVSTGEHKRNKMSLHLQYDRLINGFTATIGMRGDKTSDFDLSPAGNFGISHEIGENILIKTNAGYAENIPSFGQLYQPSHGSIDQVRGNPNLLKEKVLSYDISFNYNNKKIFNFESSLFRTQTKDLIVYERGTDLINRPLNINKGIKQGIEISCKYSLTGQFFIDFNYIWQDTKNCNTDKKLRYSPEHKGKLSLKYFLNMKTRIETIIRSYSSQYTDIENSQETKLSAYTCVDLKLIQPFQVKSLKPELYIHFYNLFDTDYESHYGYPNDGFRLMCGMNLNF